MIGLCAHHLRRPRPASARNSNSDFSDFPAPRQAGRASQRMSGNQAQRDACGIFDVVAPLESAFPEGSGRPEFKLCDTVMPATETTPRAVAIATAAPAPRRPSQDSRKPKTNGTPMATIRRYPAFEIERVDDDMVGGEQNYDRNNQISHQVGTPLRGSEAAIAALPAADGVGRARAAPADAGCGAATVRSMALIRSIQMGMKVAAGRHFRRVEECKFLETRRQFSAARHLGALDQDRNKRQVPRQRGLDLGPDRVGFLAHPDRAGGIDTEPLRADHHDQRFRFPAARRGCATENRFRTECCRCP